MTYKTTKQIYAKKLKPLLFSLRLNIENDRKQSEPEDIAKIAHLSQM